MIARAVAAQTSSSFYLINGPEIISKYVGESEGKLGEVFAQARRNAPSIIFIDEIDSLCPKRDENSDELQKRVVASLLTLMDGSAAAETNHRVMVIGATNRPDSIDTAMRRAGRFDRELEIGIPNESKRFDILRKMIRNMPHCLTEKEVREHAHQQFEAMGGRLVLARMYSLLPRADLCFVPFSFFFVRLLSLCRYFHRHSSHSSPL